MDQSDDVAESQETIGLNPLKQVKAFGLSWFPARIGNCCTSLNPLKQVKAFGPMLMICLVERVILMVLIP